MTDAETLLKGTGLSCAPGGRPLWGPLDLRLRAGEALAVTGPSGSGKSLLLRALAGLDPLLTGEVRLCGRTLDEWGAPPYRAALMYLPQRAPLYPGSVEDNLCLPFGLRVHGAASFSATEAQRLLTRLERPANFLGQQAERLSGGEAQLMALVRALLLGPRVLLLDEATSALDPAATLAAEALLTDWLKQPGRALVLVSHDPAQRQRLATREQALRAPA